jgi:hypothetical protein
MARINWLDDDNDLPALDEHVQQLEHFMTSMADGVIDEQELATQNTAVVTAMKAVQDDLTDEQHAKVTKLLVEVAALSVMSTLHGLASSREQQAPAE